MLIRQAFALLNRLLPAEEASAHCDIPCGIYDPHLAQIAALTVVRMNQLINDLGDAPSPGDKQKNDAWHNSFARYVATKEEHAELVKREVRVIWGDFFKPEHLEKFPELHNTVWNIMKLASKARQEVNMEAAQALLEEVNRFAEAFWAAKGVNTARQPTRQTAGGEFAVPVA